MLYWLHDAWEGPAAAAVAVGFTLCILTDSSEVAWLCINLVQLIQPLQNDLCKQVPGQQLVWCAVDTGCNAVRAAAVIMPIAINDSGIDAERATSAYSTSPMQKQHYYEHCLTATLW